MLDKRHSVMLECSHSKRHVDVPRHQPNRKEKPEMLNFENMSRPEMIAARRTIRDNLDTLTAIYKDTCTGNPADTVKALARKIGKDAARETIANLVNATSRADGRVSAAAHVWAESIDNAASPADLDRMGFYPNIHPAHINQLADAAR